MKTPHYKVSVLEPAFYYLLKMAAGQACKTDKTKKRLYCIMKIQDESRRKGEMSVRSKKKYGPPIKSQVRL